MWDVVILQYCQLAWDSQNGPGPSANPYSWALLNKKLFKWNDCQTGHTHTYIVHLGKWSTLLRLDMRLLKVISPSYIFIRFSVFCYLCLVFPHLHYNPPWFSPVYVCVYSMCVKAEADGYKRLLTMLSGKPLFNELLINDECWFTLRNECVCSWCDVVAAAACLIVYFLICRKISLFLALH